MKKFLIVFIIALSFLCGAALSASASAAQDGELRIYSQSEVGNYKTLSVVDHVTGVNYVVFICNGEDVAICPRYNADGSHFLSKID